ncbi:MAG: 5'/3'-nucleotidase SurE [Chlorobi bacterium]|nr:5'/3'-nucleotidase SurE [Chlorobiota bacterium]
MKDKKKPLILITNDDGIKAGGLVALVEIAKKIGEVVVVVPNESYSAMSHAITVKHPLYVKEIKHKKSVTLYKVTGTPVDCIKLAINKLLDRKPDVVVSGINHGSNSSVSIHYSGTMGAAREGAINGIPAIGFSLLSHSYDADFSHTKPYVKKILKYVLANGLPEGTYLNVNIPKESDLKGLKVCRQAKGKWVEELIEREDPRKRKYYWLTGYFKNFEPDATDTDEYALGNGYVSLVPCTIDTTDYQHYDILKNIENELQV